MREARELYDPMFSQYSNHSFSRKLSKIAERLDAHPEVNDWVLKDLATGSDPRGAKGMTAESVVRAAILMQAQELTYDELEFQLADSQAGRAFARIPDGRSFSRSTLQENISAISAETWQRIQRLTVIDANEEKIETGRTVRMDATAVETNIAFPIDSHLLVDALRVVSRVVFWLNENGKRATMAYSHKAGRKQMLQILDANGDEQRQTLYIPLIIGAGDVFKQLASLMEAVMHIPLETPRLNRRLKELENVQTHLGPIIAQTIARVIDGESVAAKDKIVSLFEPETDVIVKGGRETQFGHKVFFTTGKSNLVIDATIEEGNPSDSDVFPNLLDRLKALYGRYPRQTTCDGGFASEENVALAKELGVKDVCFAKRCALAVEDMCSSRTVFKKLRNLRAGVESNISALKRAFGLTRIRWQGFEGFRASVWSSIVAYNLILLAS